MSQELDRLKKLSRDAADLAVLASIAARVDRALLRALRLDLLNEADATAETDLWFSDIVARRTSNEIALRTELLDELRAQLGTKLERARACVKRMHADTASLLELEERLIHAALSGESTGDLERMLGTVVETLRTQPSRARDVASWALSALPRLPKRVRDTGAALSLVIEAGRHARYTVSLQAVGPSTPLPIDASAPTVPLRVRRVGDQFVFGGDEGHEIQVIATEPRFVIVDHNGKREGVSVESGTERTVPIGEEPVTLLNLRGDRWKVHTLRAEPSHDPASGVENGLWVLLDGMGNDPVPERRVPIETIADELCDGGFSIITHDTGELAGSLARAFLERLRRRGHRDGVYRIAQIVLPGSYLDHPGLKLSLDDERPEDAALARADGVVVLGTGTSGVEPRARELQLPVGRVRGGATPKKSPLQAPLAAMRGRFDGWVPSADLVPLLERAAICLDEKEVNLHRQLVRELERETARIAITSENLTQLLTDARRPSFRLFGALHLGPREVESLRDFSLTLAAWLRAEQRTVRLFGSTRTLVFALKQIAAIAERQPQPGGAAIAASCASIERDLMTRVDNESQEALHALREAGTRLQTFERATFMSNRARELESAVQGMSAAEMARARMSLVERVHGQQITEEGFSWLAGASSGERLIALGLLGLAPLPIAFPLLARLIETLSLQPEHELLLADALRMVPRLPQQNLTFLREFAVRVLANPHNGEESRLAGDLLSAIEKRIPNQTPLVDQDDDENWEIVARVTVRRGDRDEMATGVLVDRKHVVVPAYLTQDVDVIRASFINLPGGFTTPANVVFTDSQGRLSVLECEDGPPVPELLPFARGLGNLRGKEWLGFTFERGSREPLALSGKVTSRNPNGELQLACDVEAEITGGSPCIVDGQLAGIVIRRAGTSNVLFAAPLDAVRSWLEKRSSSVQFP